MAAYNKSTSSEGKDGGGGGVAGVAGAGGDAPPSPVKTGGGGGGGDDPDSSSSDGLVLVWNLAVKGRPEFVFTCQSPVLTVQFHRNDPHLVIGGTYSGQIVMW